MLFSKRQFSTQSSPVPSYLTSPFQASIGIAPPQTIGKAIVAQKLSTEVRIYSPLKFFPALRVQDACAEEPCLAMFGRQGKKEYKQNRTV